MPFNKLKSFIGMGDNSTQPQQYKKSKNLEDDPAFKAMLDENITTQADPETGVLSLTSKKPLGDRPKFMSQEDAPEPTVKKEISVKLDGSPEAVAKATGEDKTTSMLLADSKDVVAKEVGEGKKEGGDKKKFDAKKFALQAMEEFEPTEAATISSGSVGGGGRTLDTNQMDQAMSIFQRAMQNKPISESQRVNARVF